MLNFSHGENVVELCGEMQEKVTSKMKVAVFVSTKGKGHFSYK